MNRKERLLRSVAGSAVDRPAVSFYEIDGFSQRIDDPDPFNIFNDPSWRPLIELAAAKTDRLVRTPAAVCRNGRRLGILPDGLEEVRIEEGDRRRVRHTAIKVAGGGVLTGTYLTEADVDTTWCTEHPVKNADDLRRWIELPDEELSGSPVVKEVLRIEAALGDTGVAMLDIADPLCRVAQLMPMEEYTVIALTEPELFTRALEKAARFVLWNTEKVAAALPGRIWRIVGPEYASPPYLPPAFFRDYVTRFDREMCRSILKYGGYPRLHCHGRIGEILDDIVATGCVALDPVEPPPQGDVALATVRAKYGDRLTLFGNLEASDIENLSEAAFRAKVRQAIAAGTAGRGRGFVLMPSACPYGRKLPAAALRNYEVMIEEIERL